MAHGICTELCRHECQLGWTPVSFGDAAQGGFPRVGGPACDGWENGPLLRWDGFAPKARGIRQMLPHVDSLRAGHSIATLEQLAVALGQPEDIGEKARLMRMLSDG